MNKQQFKKGFSEFRKATRAAVRSDNKSAFFDLCSSFFNQFKPSDRPVSISIWLYKRG
ncbi:hypothetical protein HGO23_06270 [Xenorhabdus budapestensis]|uniref:Uncharacterized protein n=1 Tax=Xenorhabdus budapestensis TaxID=290110 RepID=A0ABX7VK30_XENBU|nr:hypothetical protein [Xenorhabdus budapestensis]QTL40943.1 hypothetical protein HGO23_06270 [Xenorhabdus budapestensis]